MRTVPQVASWQLRADFAQRMAATYGREVPAYNTLVNVAGEVNSDVLARDGASAERLGSITRVTAERHGAIRVGTPAELRDVARVFGALGMLAVGFYDLRDAARSAVPVISTAFRPIDAGELARNPFRMFTSMLVTDDRALLLRAVAGAPGRVSRPPHTVPRRADHLVRQGDCHRRPRW